MKFKLWMIFSSYYDTNLRETEQIIKKRIIERTTKAVWDLVLSIVFVQGFEPDLKHDKQWKLVPSIFYMAVIDLIVNNSDAFISFFQTFFDFVIIKGVMTWEIWSEILELITM